MYFSLHNSHINNGDSMSFWGKDLNKEAFPSLEKEKIVDTLIIGGGIAGLTTLYYLKDIPNVCLVDASLVGEGVTKNTTGKLTFLQNTIYSDLTKNIHYDTAASYLKSQKMAIELAKEIIESEKIDCHLEKVDSYVFTNKESEVKKLKQEREFLTSQGIEVKEGNLPLKVPYLSAISVSDTYVFHPILYINHLKKLLKDKIYEYTKITEIKRKDGKYICYSDKTRIIASNVIVACHYPFFFLPFCLPLKSHIEKSYIMARKVEKNPKFSAITVSNPGISVRFYEDKSGIYEICLASSHKTSKDQDDLKNFQNVKRIFNIKDEDIVASWSNVDIITDDKLPYIGEMKKNFYVATGFNTWGMTNGILAGFLLSRKVLGEKMPFEDLFLVQRSNFYQVKNFFPNLIGSAISFIGSKKHKKDWYKGDLVFTKKNGKSIAIYKDKNDKKHIVYTTCPHMGCSLLFNEKELTWDCPCHSSRFTLDGECIKGPSKKDIKYRE